jgi:cytochrome b involved in lipid metabolism
MERLILTLFGRKFDMTEFASSHPGGEEILKKYSGKDATDAFYEAGHLSKHGIFEQLAKLEVGVASPKQAVAPEQKYIPNYYQRIGKPKL